MEQASNDTRKRVITGIVAVAILALLAAGVFALRNNDQQAAANQPADTQNSSDTIAQTSTNPQTVPESTTSSATYKDGTYTAGGSYTSPGGNERVNVTVTLKDDKITDATVTPTPASPTSSQYQGQFVANFKQFVVGKDADQVSLSRVSGSSLTSRGFNNALDQIKQQAKA
ncbi:MAG TPA: FMN-binding protein [Candidatus Saccharimonadales bacterium]|nr:FMN-binding protein [Candidatus Saccharimonadales bacterium]